MIPSATLDAFSGILREVREMFPGTHPVIGGGALRDAFHGRPIKDVDVFLRAAEFPLGVRHPSAHPIIPAHASYGLRSDMHGVWDVRMSRAAWPVQFIVADFDGPADLAQTFDLGFSRITFDGEDVHYSDDFIRDSAAKAFRILRNDDDGSTSRSERRIDRLSEKYPDFTRKAA